MDYCLKMMPPYARFATSSIQLLLSIYLLLIVGKWLVKENRNIRLEAPHMARFDTSLKPKVGLSRSFLLTFFMHPIPFHGLIMKQNPFAQASFNLRRKVARQTKNDVLNAA